MGSHPALSSSDIAVICNRRRKNKNRCSTTFRWSRVLSLESLVASCRQNSASRAQEEDLGSDWDFHLQGKALRTSLRGLSDSESAGTVRAGSSNDSSTSQDPELECSLAVDIDMTEANMQNILLQVGGEGIRVRLHCMPRLPYQSLGWMTTSDTREWSL